MDKKVLNICQQINLLKKRKLLIDDNSIDSIFNFFLENNYDVVINGYSAPFFEDFPKREKYKKDVSIWHIISLYNFDKKLMSLLFQYVIKIERCFKQVVIYHFLLETSIDFYKQQDIVTNGIIFQKQDINSAKNNDYIWEKFKKLFTVFNIDKFNHEEAKKFYKMLFQNVSYAKSLKFKKFENKKYDIPIWRLSQSWTFGQTLKFYKSISIDIQIKIRKHFSNIQFISEKEFLFEMLSKLKALRNVIFHDNEVFSFKIKKIHKKHSKKFQSLFNLCSINKDIHFFKKLKKSDNSEQERNSINFFKIILIILFLLREKKEIKSLSRKIIKLIKNLEEEVLERDFKIILNILGIDYDKYKNL